MLVGTQAKRGFSEREAAAYLGLSVSFLRQARTYGRLGGQTQAPPFIKIGRAVRYIKEDLDNWLDAHQKATTLSELHTQCVERLTGGGLNAKQ